MSLPREPRQKMINMMYLVLTALLALNVSAEILNAFKTVNTSLENTNTTVNKSTETIMKSLADKATDPATAVKAQIWLPKAQQVQGYAKEVYSYIQGVKDDILTKAGGDPKDPAKKYKDDNLDIPTRVLIDKGAGKMLLQKLTDYKSNLLTKIDPLVATEFANSLPINLEKPKKSDKSWEYTYFHMVPVVAALTILSKFQMDVKTSENKVVAYCHEQVGKVAVRFDTYTAIVGQSSNYVMPGQKLDIMAGVGAFSKSALPQISINGANVPLGPDGQAIQSIEGGAIGQHSVNVKIAYKDQDGKDQVIDKVITYTVGQANASIALDKMNVLYIGVDNPISIAASGGGDDRIQVTMAGGGGNIVRSGAGAGKWNARVSSVTDDCKITVTVDGKIAGVSQFRVRTIPKSQAYVGGNESGVTLSAGAFKAQTGVAAGIRDFPFELKYTVLSFSMSIDKDDGDIATVQCQGNLFSPQAKTVLNNEAKAGKTVTIDEIKVLGPDGTTKSAPSLVYYLK
jgi:gliding motility-associated protein GldM